MTNVLNVLNICIGDRRLMLMISTWWSFLEDVNMRRQLCDETWSARLAEHTFEWVANGLHSASLSRDNLTIMSSTDWGEQCSVFLSPVEILQVGHLSEEEGPAQSSGMEPRPIKASSGHRAILSMPTRKRFFSLSSFAPGHLPSPPPPPPPPLSLSLSLFLLFFSTCNIPLSVEIFPS